MPNTLLSGFLGTAKTTLHNHFLHGNYFLKIAAPVSWFGAIDIDAQRVVGVYCEALNLQGICI